MTSNYWDKYNEATYNLEQAQELFLIRSNALEFCINNFLSSVQSIFWMLNKNFSSAKEYTEWQNDRTNRLHEDAKIFKELRNISLKEYPIKVNGIILGFKIEEPWLPAGATFTSPIIDTRNGSPISNKWTILTIEWYKYEIDALAIHDFSVNAISNGKVYYIDIFITKAKLYLESIKEEILMTELKFNKQ